MAEINYLQKIFVFFMLFLVVNSNIHLSEAQEENNQNILPEGFKIIDQKEDPLTITQTIENINAETSELKFGDSIIVKDSIPGSKIILTINKETGIAELKLIGNDDIIVGERILPRIGSATVKINKDNKICHASYRAIQGNNVPIKFDCYESKQGEAPQLGEAQKEISTPHTIIGNSETRFKGGGKHNIEFTSETGALIEYDAEKGIFRISEGSRGDSKINVGGEIEEIILKGSSTHQIGSFKTSTERNEETNIYFDGREVVRENAVSYLTNEKGAITQIKLSGDVEVVSTIRDVEQFSYKGEDSSHGEIDLEKNMITLNGEIIFRSGKDFTYKGEKRTEVEIFDNLITVKKGHISITKDGKLFKFENGKLILIKELEDFKKPLEETKDIYIKDEKTGIEIKIEKGKVSRETSEVIFIEKNKELISSLTPEEYKELQEEIGRLIKAKSIPERERIKKRLIEKYPQIKETNIIKEIDEEKIKYLESIKKQIEELNKFVEEEEIELKFNYWNPLSYFDLVFQPGDWIGEGKERKNNLELAKHSLFVLQQEYSKVSSLSIEELANKYSKEGAINPEFNDLIRRQNMLNERGELSLEDEHELLSKKAEEYRRLGFYRIAEGIAELIMSETFTEETKDIKDTKNVRRIKEYYEKYPSSQADIINSPEKVLDIITALEEKDAQGNPIYSTSNPYQITTLFPFTPEDIPALKKQWVSLFPPRSQVYGLRELGIDTPLSKQALKEKEVLEQDPILNKIAMQEMVNLAATTVIAVDMTRMGVNLALQSPRLLNPIALARDVNWFATVTAPRRVKVINAEVITPITNRIKTGFSDATGYIKDIPKKVFPKFTERRATKKLIKDIPINFGEGAKIKEINPDGIIIVELPEGTSVAQFSMTKIAGTETRGFRYIGENLGKSIREGSIELIGPEGKIYRVIKAPEVTEIPKPPIIEPSKQSKIFAALKEEALKLKEEAAGIQIKTKEPTSAELLKIEAPIEIKPEPQIILEPEAGPGGGSILESPNNLLRERKYKEATEEYKRIISDYEKLNPEEGTLGFDILEAAKKNLRTAEEKLTSIKEPSAPLTADKLNLLSDINSITKQTGLNIDQVVDRILDIDYEAFKDQFYGETRKEVKQRVKERFKTLLNEGRIIVSVLDGKIVGFLTTKDINADSRSLGTLAVDPSVRGRGIGTSLMDQAVLNAIKDNKQNIEFEVLDNSLLPFYESFTSSRTKATEKERGFYLETSHPTHPVTGRSLPRLFNVKIVKTPTSQLQQQASIDYVRANTKDIPILQTNDEAALAAYEWSRNIITEEQFLNILTKAGLSQIEIEKLKTAMILGTLPGKAPAAESLSAEVAKLTEKEFQLNYDAQLDSFVEINANKENLRNIYTRRINTPEEYNEKLKYDREELTGQYDYIPSTSEVLEDRKSLLDKVAGKVGAEPWKKQVSGFRGYKTITDLDVIDTRFYLNIRRLDAEGHEHQNVVNLFEELFTKLNREGIRASWKTYARPEGQVRADNTVLYVSKGDTPKVTKILKEINANHQEWFAENGRIPLFTKRIAEGVGAATEPKSRESFGSIIILSVENGMAKAKEKGITDVEGIKAEIKKQFEINGLNPEKPYLDKEWRTDPFTDNVIYPKKWNDLQIGDVIVSKTGTERIVKDIRTTIKGLKEFVVEVHKRGAIYEETFKEDKSMEFIKEVIRSEGLIEEVEKKIHPISWADILEGDIIVSKSGTERLVKEIRIVQGAREFVVETRKKDSVHEEIIKEDAPISDIKYVVRTKAPIEKAKPAAEIPAAVQIFSFDNSITLKEGETIKLGRNKEKNKLVVRIPGSEDTKSQAYKDTMRISKEHAEISLKGGKLYIKDTSTNGVFIDGLRIKKGVETEIKPEEFDQVKFADVAYLSIEVVEKKLGEAKPSLTQRALSEQPRQALLTELQNLLPETSAENLNKISLAIQEAQQANYLSEEEQLKALAILKIKLRELNIPESKIIEIEEQYKEIGIGGLGVAGETEIKFATTKIIKTMENYEPIGYPNEGEEKARQVGSNVPNSYFIYKDRKILVKTYFDQEDNILYLNAIDESGDILEDVVDEYDAWSWSVKGKENIKKMNKEMDKIGDKAIAEGRRNPDSETSPSEGIYRAFSEKDIPESAKRLYDVKKERVQQKRKVLEVRAQISENGIPQLRYVGFGSSHFTLGGKNILSDEIFQNILRQVADNINPFVGNPELHLTLDEIEDRLKPGRSSQIGFMAEDEHLWEIIEADTKVLEKAGVTHEQIAEKLDYLFSKTEESWEATVDQKYKVVRLGAHVLQDDPWGILDDWHVHTTGKKDPKKYDVGYLGKKYSSYTNRIITNLETRESITLPGMAPHLIGDHHFFEGSTDYRMDPEQLIKVLDIKPTSSLSQRALSEQPRQAVLTELQNLLPETSAETLNKISLAIQEAQKANYLSEEEQLKALAILKVRLRELNIPESKIAEIEKQYKDIGIGGLGVAVEVEKLIEDLYSLDEDVRWDSTKRLKEISKEEPKALAIAIPAMIERLSNTGPEVSENMIKDILFALKKIGDLNVVDFLKNIEKSKPAEFNRLLSNLEGLSKYGRDNKKYYATRILVEFPSPAKQKRKIK